MEKNGRKQQRFWGTGQNILLRTDLIRLNKSMKNKQKNGIKKVSFQSQNLSNFQKANLKKNCF